ncbi:MAG: patatin-like phospholipase family protein [Candidatus Rokuibacteriota bacterium]
MSLSPCRFSVLSVLVVLLAGCAAPLSVTLPRAASDTSCTAAAPDAELLVGLTLSGGGSRAALFGQAGLEALGSLPAPGGGSVLERVMYVSSVSGGGLPAAYFAKHKPPRETPMLTPAGTLTEEYRAFFGRFRELVSQDFESALLWRQLGTFRWLDSALAARSLREILEERLLGTGKFADLLAREVRGDSPHMMFNTTLFNNGRRFVITTVPPEDSRYDFFVDLRRSLAQRGLPADISPWLERRWQRVLALTPHDLHIDPCEFRVAGAVAGSASFPPLVGPFTIRVEGEKRYWHFGDGGLYENAGIETLLFVFLKKLQEKKARRGLIITFDSSFPFDVGERRLSLRAQPFSLLTYDFSRIPSIMEERAGTYAAFFWRSLQLEGVFPDNDTLRIVVLRHTDARWRDDLSDLPEACRQEEPRLESAEDVVERLAEIPTRFYVASACDRQLLAVSAAKVVQQNREYILELLATRPAPAR